MACPYITPVSIAISVIPNTGVSVYLGELHNWALSEKAKLKKQHIV
jgi:hypothetical protein